MVGHLLLKGKPISRVKIFAIFVKIFVKIIVNKFLINIINILEFSFVNILKWNNIIFTIFYKRQKFADTRNHRKFFFKCWKDRFENNVCDVSIIDELWSSTLHLAKKSGKKNKSFSCIVPKNCRIFMLGLGCTTIHTWIYLRAFVVILISEGFFPPLMRYLNL